MQSLIESLESRRLLSATVPALAAFNAEAKVIAADFRTVGSVGSADVKTIIADLKSAGLQKTDKAAAKTLTKGDTAAGKLLLKALNRTDKSIVSEVKKLASTSGKLAKKPTNAKLIAAVAALKSTLSTVAANDLSTLINDGAALSNVNTANSNALSSSNPTDTQLGNDVHSSQTSLDSALQTLSQDVTLALTTDVNNIIAQF